MGCIKKPWFNTLAVIVCLLGLAGLSGSMAFAANATGGWKWKADASAGFAYNSNVYKLSSIQSDRFDKDGAVAPVLNSPNFDQNRAAADQISGRYKDMDSLSDFIFTPRLGASFSRSAIMGKDFSLKPSVAYHRYSRNQEKSYFDFGLDLNQSLGKNGDIGLELSYAPNIFKKNFLSDAQDTRVPPGTKNKISAEEKIFSPAHYDNTRVILSYGRRLWKSNRKVTQIIVPKALSGKVLAGYGRKSYDDPFSIRDEDALFAGFNLKMAMHKSTTLAFNYLFKNINTTVGTEVLVRDEPTFGVDLNDDGNKTGLNIRTEQNVDRSRNSHTLGAKVSTRLVKGWTGYAKYEARFTSYKSEETFDLSRLNRDDTRQKFGIGVKGRLAPRWYLSLGWINTNSHVNRSGIALVDQTEVKSYNINIYSAIITYRL